MKKVFIILLLFGARAISAFETAGLEITVTDQSSAVVPNFEARLIQNDLIVNQIKSGAAQKILFSNIKPGFYVLEIEAPGFTKFSEEIELIGGANRRAVRLTIAEIVENVTVNSSTQDKNLDPREGAFTNFLTKSELAALPDDPALMKKALQQKFGEDAVFLVDGFTSEGLPRKSEIASIKVSQSSFDAEHHKIGIAIIEITTKPSSRFFGAVSLGFNDAIFNAREPFSVVRNPERNRAFGLLLWSPIKKDRTSFSIAAGNSDSFNTATVTARLPEGNIDDPSRSRSNQIYFDGKVTHNLSQFQTVNVSYSFNRGKSRNLGVGGFDLPDRAFNLNVLRNRVRYSQIGNVGERFFNEFRFQIGTETTSLASVNQSPAIIVLDAFNKGGAGNDGASQSRTFSVADNLLWGLENHALKVGALFDYKRRKTIAAENQFGTFTFSSLSDFLQNKPSVFTRKPGARDVTVSQFQLGAFMQDDVRLRKSLMLSFGLRYEWQNNLKDSNNFSPRIGFAWSPAENGKITFRGGVGVFYDWFEPSALANILGHDANQPPETIIVNPGFPNAGSGGAPQVLPRSYWEKSSDLQNPYVLLAQLGVQRQLTGRAALRVQYTYQKGVRQFRLYDSNAPVDFVRPDAALGQILQYESTAFFVRNSLKADLTMTPTKTTFLSVNYRLAKSVSDADGEFGLPSNNYNFRLDRAASNTDQRHNVNAAFNWALPKSFRFSAFFYANSGFPYTIKTGRDDNGDTIFNDRPAGIARNSARGTWQKQVDMSFSWQLRLEKNKAESPKTPDAETEVIRGRTLMFRVDASNVFNQTNFNGFSGVQTSPFFRQPVSAGKPRKVDLNLRFTF